MNMLQEKKNFEENWRRFLPFGMLLLVILTTFWVVHQTASADTVDVERASLGTGGVESDAASFYLSLSEDASIVTFESFNSNWWADQHGVNYVDIFVRDRASNVTTKISVSQSGDPSDQRSFDPFISADGRYVSFTSYATNLVYGDTNRHEPIDDGLDVFLYDRYTGTLQRVSLDWKGHQIDANSVGLITPNAEYAIFNSNGNRVAPGDYETVTTSAIYKRNIQTGTVERISKGLNGELPDGGVGGPDASYDGRYIVYITNANNVVPGGTNDFADVVLYDSVTQETTLVSKGMDGGYSNNLSGPARISSDGRFVVFRSYASNLVPGDTDGMADIFVYEVSTGEIEMVSVSSAGVSGNGTSQDASICGNGRYVVFTSEATNLVSQPSNGERQVYVHDRQRHETFVASVNNSGELGNGRAHRGALSADCSTVGFATDANNIVANDTNGARDLFMARIMYPADLSPSFLSAYGNFEAGQTITYTVALHNRGTETVTASLIAPIPTNTTYVAASLADAGGTYNSAFNQIEWNGSILGESEVSFTYAVVIDASVADFTLIINQGTLTGDGNSYDLKSVGIINGLKTFMPIVAQN